MADGGLEARIPCYQGMPRLREWAQRYDVASHREQQGALIAIGREMFGWLNDTGWAAAWADGLGERRLEILVGAAESDDAAVLLDAPWELLAHGHVPLALDDQMLQVYSPCWRAGSHAGAGSRRYPPDVHGGGADRTNGARL